MLGDKWTMLVVRELVSGPKRTMELLASLFPISSRTLVGRLRDMEKDALLERTDFGGNPPHIEYALTERGRVLLPLVDALRKVGETLDCNQCEDRMKQMGYYCEACPQMFPKSAPEVYQRPAPAPRRRQRDDIVLL